MAYSLATVSPNSWQLQRGSGLAPFAPLRRRVPAVLHCGIKRVGRPIRSGAIAGNGDGEGNKNPIEPQSWEADSSSTNSYSGWFSSDQNPGRKNFTGYVAAGAAGLILTIGFAFASQSFFSRRGVKSQLMVPLIATQETILSFDDSHSAIADHDRESDNLISADAHEPKQNEETGMRVEDSNNLHETAGTDQSSLSLEETNGMRFEVAADLSFAPVTTSIPNDEVKISEPDPVNVDPITNCMNVASGPLSDSTVIAKSENIDGFAVVPQSEPNSVATSESANNEPSPVESYCETKSICEICESDGATSMTYSETSTTFHIVDMESSVVSPVSGSNLLDMYTGSQIAEPNLEEGRSSIEKILAVSIVPDHTIPSDSAIPEPSTPTELGMDQNSALAIPSHIPETRETEQIFANNEIPLVSETIPSTVIKDFSESALARETSESRLNEIDDAIGLTDIDSFDLNVRRTSMFESLSSESEHSFPSPGIPAPSHPVLHVTPGKVVVPPVVDHLQGQAFAALQALKVVEAGIEPNGLCTRREYARWLIASSAILARNPVSKVFPAMFIENVTELAYDDVTPEDPDFSSIQGLAEAGLISSKLSNHDTFGSVEGGKPNIYLFSPDSPLSRQALVSWKIALEKKLLPEVTRKMVWEKTGFIDIDKIHQDAWPAVVVDLTSGEQSIIGVAFGHTRLFQPDKPATKAQAAVALATGEASELVNEELARLEAESLADTAVAAHAALEAQVQKDLNDSFKRELELEREKIKDTERLAEVVKSELDRVTAERDKEKYSLMKEKAAIDSEREFFSSLRNELEQQLQTLSTNKLQIDFERDQVARLRKEAEEEKEASVRIRSEVEVEKAALLLARSWAEEEAKKARAHAKVLKEAREKWERQGIEVRVDKELDEDNIIASTWQYSPGVQKDPEEVQKDPEEVQKDSGEIKNDSREVHKDSGEVHKDSGEIKNDSREVHKDSGEVHKDSGESPLHDILVKAEEIRGKFLLVFNDLMAKISALLEKLIHAFGLLITSLRQKATVAGERAQELQQEALLVATKAAHDVQQSTASSVAGVTYSIREGTKRLADEFREGAEKISQKFKT